MQDFFDCALRETRFITVSFIKRSISVMRCVRSNTHESDAIGEEDEDREEDAPERSNDEYER